MDVLYRRSPTISGDATAGGSKNSANCWNVAGELFLGSRLSKMTVFNLSLPDFAVSPQQKDNSVMVILPKIITKKWFSQDLSTQDKL